MADAPKNETKQSTPKETEVERLARCVKERKVCSGTFVIGKEGHYRLGKLYAEGELITIDEEVPSKTWKPYDPHYKAPPAIPAAAPKSPLSPGEIAI